MGNTICARLIVAAATVGVGTNPLLAATVPDFTEVSAAAGLAVEHQIVGGPANMAHTISGGMAAADFDLDGWVDIYFQTADSTPNRLFRNNGDGTFTDVAGALGVGLPGHLGTGPAFADVDGDGFPELFVGGVSGSGLRVFRNLAGADFEEITGASGFAPPVLNQNDFSFAFADPDKDGDLDVFVAHWSFDDVPNAYWLNDGTGTFSAADASHGLDVFQPESFNFTPNFVDLDEDGWLDLVVAADFGTSSTFLNDGTGRFVETTDPAVITDENGMGAAVADFNGDGHVDWFISSIWDPNGISEGSWGITGNRMYFGNGDGTFTDATDHAGVRQGYWGWGACAEDFDNDGWIDLYHVNGFLGGQQIGEFIADPARLFMNDGDGAFQEVSAEAGVADTGQGRGVACFDYDHDGDVDIFVANNSGPLRLFRNDTSTANRSVTLDFAGLDAARVAGAQVSMRVDGVTRSRQLTIGSNFASQNPSVAHFGLGRAARAEDVQVTWPDGSIQSLGTFSAGRRVDMRAPRAPVAAPHPVPLGPGSTLLLVLGVLGSAGISLSARRAAGAKCRRGV